MICLVLLEECKYTKYTAVFLSINNETQCALLLFLLSRLILGKLFLEKMSLNLGSQLK